MSCSWASAVGGTPTHHRTQQYLPAPYFMPELCDLLRKGIYWDSSFQDRFSFSIVYLSSVVLLCLGESSQKHKQEKACKSCRWGVAYLIASPCSDLIGEALLWQNLKTFLVLTCSSWNGRGKAPRCLGYWAKELREVLQEASAFLAIKCYLVPTNWSNQWIPVLIWQQHKAHCNIWRFWKCLFLTAVLIGMWYLEKSSMFYSSLWQAEICYFSSFSAKTVCTV